MGSSWGLAPCLLNLKQAIPHTAALMVGGDAWQGVPCVQGRVLPGAGAAAPVTAERHLGPGGGVPTGGLAHLCSPVVAVARPVWGGQGRAAVEQGCRLLPQAVASILLGPVVLTVVLTLWTRQPLNASLSHATTP